MVNKLALSKEAKCRLEWIIYYQTKAKNNVSLVCRHFGIGRATFYKWFKKFDEINLRILETKSRKPKKVRSRQANPNIDQRLIDLRKKYPYFGKMKLRVLYEKQYGRSISSWYVQRVIQEYKLYFKKKPKHYTQRNWGNFHPDPRIFNEKLTNWLVEYNAIRPHESLNYLTPLEYAQKTMHLSTMWSSCTEY